MTANKAAILSRAFQPDKGNLSPEAARSILGLSISPDDQQRASELAAKAREGLLTENDLAELNDFREVGRLLELLKSKARLSLQQARAA